MEAFPVQILPNKPDDQRRLLVALFSAIGAEPVSFRLRYQHLYANQVSHLPIVLAQLTVINTYMYSCVSDPPPHEWSFQQTDRRRTYHLAQRAAVMAPANPCSGRQRCVPIPNGDRRPPVSSGLP